MSDDFVPDDDYMKWYRVVIPATIPVDETKFRDDFIVLPMISQDKTRLHVYRFKDSCDALMLNLRSV